MFQLAVWIVLHLGAWALMLLCAAGLGELFLRKHQFASGIERLVFTLALGLGLSALFIFGLGLARLLYPQIILGLTLAGALGTIVHFSRRFRSQKLPDLICLRPPYTDRGILLIILGLIGVCYWGLLLLSALYPPMHWDAISHHLVLSREYLTAHRLFAVMNIPHPVLPALNHMLFTWALAVKDDVLAQMIEHTFLMLTALGLYAWGKRENRPLFGLAMAAFWLGSPLVLLLGESAYIDISLVTFVFLGIYSLRIFWEHGETRWWYLAMALLGMAAGAKVSGMFFVIAGGALGLWVVIRSRFGTIRKYASEPRETPAYSSLAIGWLVGFVILLPWYAFVFYYTGDPVWPTLPELGRGAFGNPAVIANIHGWLQSSGEPRTLTNFLMLSIDWIRYPPRFFCENNLTLFPLLAVWPLAWVVGLWNRSVRWWALWALSFTIYWFFFPHQLRYWLPALPLAILALCETLRWLVEKLTASETLHATVWVGLGLVAVLWGSSGLVREVGGKGFPPPTNPQAREALLSMIGGYKGVRYINENAGKTDTVTMIGASYLNYYLHPRVIDLTGLLLSHRQPKLRWPEDKEWVKWQDSENVKWIIINYSALPEYVKPLAGASDLSHSWPAYELTYSDQTIWIFRRKPAGLPLGTF